MNSNGDEKADECCEFYYNDGRGPYREAEGLEDGGCGNASFHHSHADALGSEGCDVTGNQDFYCLMSSNDEAVRYDDREEDHDEDVPREGDDHRSIVGREASVVKRAGGQPRSVTRNSAAAAIIAALSVQCAMDWGQRTTR